MRSTPFTPRNLNLVPFFGDALTSPLIREGQYDAQSYNSPTDNEADDERGVAGVEEAKSGWNGGWWSSGSCCCCCGGGSYSHRTGQNWTY